MKQIQERARECCLILETLSDFVSPMVLLRKGAPAPESSVLLVRNLLYDLRKRLASYLPPDAAEKCK